MLQFRITITDLYDASFTFIPLIFYNFTCNIVLLPVQYFLWYYPVPAIIFGVLSEFFDYTFLNEAVNYVFYFFSIFEVLSFNWFKVFISSIFSPCYHFNI